jgi:selenocysteine lyase/cysteine desulfurase
MPEFEDATLFPVIKRHHWLNHAAISAWPEPVIGAAQKFVSDNQHHGALHYEDWMANEEALRGQLAKFLDADSADDISLLRNTSEALNIIATGLSWSPGDEVIFPANEFPSNLLPWAALEAQGVVVKAVTLSKTQPEQDIIAQITPKTRLVSVSAVQFDTGVRLDLDAIGQAAHHAGALFCVDAIQMLGALPLSVRHLPVDFVVSGSHKWLMAPEGMGFMWSRRGVRERMKVALPGWRMYDDPFNFNRTDWTPPPTGRRFETGTVNMFGVHGLAAAIDLLIKLGPERTASALLDRTDHIVNALSQSPNIDLLTPVERERRAGIVCFRVHGTDAECMVNQLAEQDIFVAKRGHNIRVSPHFYTPYDQIDAFLARIQDTQLLADCAA